MPEVLRPCSELSGRCSGTQSSAEYRDMRFLTGVRFVLDACERSCVAAAVTRAARVQHADQFRIIDRGVACRDVNTRCGFISMSPIVARNVVTDLKCDDCRGWGWGPCNERHQSNGVARAPRHKLRRSQTTFDTADRIGRSRRRGVARHVSALEQSGRHRTSSRFAR
ncbi:hypothetical protein chiPu_0030666, partial [Chiloscyllium punctatum]|nr:hypothetical protein [Chiloscyllium punctatum]